MGALCAPTEEVATGILDVAIAREARNTARARAGEAALTAALSKLAADVYALAAQANQLAMQRALKETADQVTKSADLLFLKEVDSVQEGAAALTAQTQAWIEPTFTLCLTAGWGRGSHSECHMAARNVA